MDSEGFFGPGWSYFCKCPLFYNESPIWEVPLGLPQLSFFSPLQGVSAICEPIMSHDSNAEFGQISNEAR